MFKTSKISYGGTAAVVTSTALVSGLSAAGATRPVIVSALLIAAIADNLADALSIHIFQESVHLDNKEALTGTAANFLTRLLLCISFIPLVATFPLDHVEKAAIVWGMSLLVGLTYLVARERKVEILPEVLKHVVIAGVVLAVSITAGHQIGALFG
jgi:VIT1/CCC1 family predicted Fe2+/Mn2+ transporter